LQDLLADTRLVTNNDRMRGRDWVIPLLRSRMVCRSAAELCTVFEQNELPFAPITMPEDLFDDAHLLASGGLGAIKLPDGRATHAPLMPTTLDGERTSICLDPPRIGEHTNTLLTELGYTSEQIAAMK